MKLEGFVLALSAVSMADWRVEMEPEVSLIVVTSSPGV